MLTLPFGEFNAHPVSNADMFRERPHMCVFVLERKLMKHPATSVSTHPMENHSTLEAHSQSVGVFLTRRSKIAH